MLIFMKKMERAKGFEPSTPTLARIQEHLPKLSDTTTEPNLISYLLTFLTPPASFSTPRNDLAVGYWWYTEKADCDGCTSSKFVDQANRRCRQAD